MMQYLTDHSIGILSPRKISSSASESSKTTGKSKNFFQKTIAEQRVMQMGPPTMPIVFTTIPCLQSGSQATAGTIEILCYFASSDRPGVLAY